MCASIYLKLTTNVKGVLSWFLDIIICPLLLVLMFICAMCWLNVEIKPIVTACVSQNIM